MKTTSIQILQILRSAGFEAYWAGGCVRDMLLGITPKDFDIVTSAKPEQIEALIEHTIPIGKKFGVILAIQDGHHYEIASFRSDGSYSDGRRPDAVIFTTAEEDAQRRDFTINALFYDPLTDLILDFVGGEADLRDRLIRFIGDPQIRLREDHLRVLRAVRFKNCYGFQYHPATYQALRKNVGLIKKVANERLAGELNKMISGTNAAQSFEDLFEIGALEILIPELCRLKGLAQPLQYHREGDVFDHSKMALQALDDEEAGPDPLPAKSASLALRWAVLLHDIGKYETFSVAGGRIRYNHHAEIGAELAEKILTRLKFPRKLIEEVRWLIAHHMMVVDLLKMPDGRRRHWFLHPYFENLLELYRADAMGIRPLTLDLYHELKRLYKHEIAKLRLMPKQLLNGEELMRATGLPAGKKIGELLKKLRLAQLEGEIKNKKTALLAVKKWLSQNT